MELLPGKIVTILILATLLATLGAWVVGWRYRAAMKRLMQAPVDAASTPPSASSPPTPEMAPPARVTLADNRRAHWRLLGWFCGLTLLIALTRTLITQWIADGPITIKTVATLGAAYAWPVLPVLAVIGRWSRWRFVGAMLLWFVAAVALLTWRTNENISFLQVLQWMSFDIGLPLVVVTALCLGGTSRAIAPWLAPLFVLLLWSSQVGIDLLAAAFNAGSPIAHAFINLFGGTGAIVAAALLPWLIAGWLVRQVGRWLAHAYSRRAISELFYLFTAVWLITLSGPALGAIHDLAWGALVVFTPLLWIPLAAWLMPRLAHKPEGRPPTLLVLRVFQQDANVQTLFDKVIERWRLTGNTVLIAGTDLVDRTIDADDIFTFLDARLGERFICHPTDLDARLAAFEFQPDNDGRHRVNECYCHDTTWQQALDRLVGNSDVVLMDLRNFKERNAGCIHELNVLATAPRLARVVVLTNDATELAAAQAAASGAPKARFAWLAQQSGKKLEVDSALVALFA